jgi:hypothetical protein
MDIGNAISNLNKKRKKYPQDEAGPEDPSWMKDDNEAKINQRVPEGASAYLKKWEGQRLQEPESDFKRYQILKKIQEESEPDFKRYQRLKKIQVHQDEKKYTDDMETREKIRTGIIKGPFKYTP